MSKAKVDLVPFSKKQQMLSTWWMPESPHADKDVIICDGAVRAGKTMVGSMSYVMWLMYTFNHQNFGMAGKSLDSLRRNIWVPIQQWFSDVGINVVRLRDTANGYILKYSYKSENGDIIKKENYLYLFGGKDEGSAAFVQGFTSAGFFFDECVLMPQSFVNQAVARCSVEGAKIWFNCNPDYPHHWFKVEWLDKLHTHNALHIHFTMADNPSLSKRTLQRYENTWEGVFYQRFVLGEWVAAEGIIYQGFASNTKDYLIDDVDAYLKQNNKRIMAVYMGVDWGHSGSANTIVAVGITDRAEEVIVLDEWYTLEELDPVLLYAKLIKFMKPITDKYGYVKVFADNAELMLVRGLSNAAAKAGIKASIPKTGCIKHEIIDRIVLENTLFAQHRIKINKKCDRLIGAFQTALWDSKSKKDVRLDDGTSNIDSLDAFEYAICTQMKQLENAGHMIQQNADGSRKWGVQHEK